MTNIATKALQGLPSWNIGVIEGETADLLQAESGRNVTWFPEQSNRYLADPFAIRIDGDIHVFFEEFPYSTRKGRISFTKYPDWFESGRIEVAHEEPFHMSYPFMMRHNSEIYAIPESCAADAVHIYRVESPSEWVLEAKILTGIGVIDPTVFNYDGTWWMFYTTDRNANAELFIQHSDSLFEGWEEHSESPVKVDPKSARSAGEPIISGGELYRPAQYCDTEYGEKIIINRVTQLTQDEFVEEKYAEIRPSDTGPYRNGCHTISSGGNNVFIDGKRRIRNSYWVKKRLKQILTYPL